MSNIEKNNIKKNNSLENIKTAFLLNLVFSIVEAIGGILTNSIAIISDSIHDLGDSISIGISYLLENKSRKKPDKQYTYGYLRYSLLGALITSLVLLTGSIIVIFKAIPKLINPSIVNHDAMIIFAIFGFLINGYAAYKTSKSIEANERSINLHMLEDTLGWIAVLIGSIIIKIFKLNIIDPILSLLITFYILFHVYKNLKSVFFIFMDKVPQDINIDELEKNIVKEFEYIENIHHIHLWTLDGINNYMTAHILLKKDISKKDIIILKSDVKSYISKLGVQHITLEIEYFDEKCNHIKCN